MVETAVIYVPADVCDPAGFAASAAPCLERVDACGYTFAGVVRTWDDAVAMVNAGQVQVIVVASLRQLPRDRSPRVETASDPVPTLARPHVAPDVVVPTVAQRRPRRIR